jgi:predicted metal-dependent HD superfamily phosphohydrolase
MEIALWLHDLFYVPMSPYNESESAGLAKHLVFGTNLCPDHIEWAILGTKESLPPKNEKKLEYETMIVCDIDLVSLAVPWAEFLANGKNIRREFKNVSDDDFNKGQAAFLKQIKDRGYVYHLDYFKNLYEDKAQSNLWAYFAYNIKQYLG